MKTKSLVTILSAAFTAAIPLTAHAARCSDGREDPSTPDNSSSSSSESASTSPSPKKEKPPQDEECIERDIFFMPGTTAVIVAPNRGKGPFFGAGVEIAPFQWSRNNDRFGPSQGSFYMHIAMLGSERTPAVMTLFETGATASFERNSSRRWLIPYFGGTIGGMSQAQLGTTGYAYPLLGVHLYWHRNLMVDAEGGYHFPFQDIDRTRGPRGQLTARFSLW